MIIIVKNNITMYSIDIGKYRMYCHGEKTVFVIIYNSALISEQ